MSEPFCSSGRPTPARKRPVSLSGRETCGGPRCAPLEREHSRDQKGRACWAAIPEAFFFVRIVTVLPDCSNELVSKYRLTGSSYSVMPRHVCPARISPAQFRSQTIPSNMAPRENLRPPYALWEPRREFYCRLRSSVP